MSHKTTWVQGATGSKPYRWTTKREVHLATGKVSHSFLHVPDCPYPLLGKDLLTKLRAQIYFKDGSASITGPNQTPLHVLTFKLEDEYKLFDKPSVPMEDMNYWLSSYPEAWAETGGMGMAKQQSPIVVHLKATATPINIKQYPMSREAYQGIKPHIKRLLDQGILTPCRSPWNTPLLPVKKPGTNDYRPVQDLREVNKRVQDIHPTVPNPYNLLNTLPPTHTWYTVLDLKDAFFCLRLSPQSQALFAFEWKDTEEGVSGQLTWMRLPQGFKNSPTLFDEALHQDLADFRVGHPSLILLQYVDDILLAAASKEDCLTGEANPHNCQQILAETQGTRPDLTDQPMKDAELVWYTDGSSYLLNGERRAGAAITTESEVIWASALPGGTSAQRAELIALTQALKLAEGKKLNIYTDSRYAFATAHIHGEIYRRRGLLTSEGKEIKNKTEILALLKALFLPKKLSIIHCPSHHKGDTPEARGNRLADETAKKAALGPQLLIMTLLPKRADPQRDDHEEQWVYKDQDLSVIQKLGATYNPEENTWKYQGKTIMPLKNAKQLAKSLHRLTHLGAKKMKELLDCGEGTLYLPNRDQLLRQIAENCQACAQFLLTPSLDGRKHSQLGMKLLRWLLKNY
ncbi:uncharacterized protein [Marmota flaviventris]|uniref:uncharacterized protein n=1 Tax=Marmota flaviventris TaxID=93162 RepID=UPI003A846646